VREAARPVTGAAGDYDPLLALVGADTRVVLVGDARTARTSSTPSARA
jgi:hypothetical protein